MCIPLLFVFYFFSHVLTRENQYISPLHIQNFLSFTNFSSATCWVKEWKTTFTILLDLYHKEEGKYTSCPDAQQFKPTVRPWWLWDTLQYCEIDYTVTSLRQCFFFPSLLFLHHLPCANIKMTKGEVKASWSRCYLERRWTTEQRTLSIRQDLWDCNRALLLLTALLLYDSLF